MIARLGFFVRQALSALLRSFGITTLAVMTIGVALAVLATFTVVVDNLKRVSDRLGRDVELSAFLGETATEAQSQVLVRQLEEWEEVAQARFLGSKQAMDEFREALGKDGLLLDGLPPDILPPSVEIQLQPKAWTTPEVGELAARIGKLPGVEDVRFGQEEIGRINSLLGFAKVAALILGAALCFATILIVSNTIRLTVYARRDEIEIMSLVGATNSFVRAPFVIEGAIQGLLGGLLALCALVLLENAVRVGLERGFSFANTQITLEFVPMELVGYLLVAGVGFGLIGSLLAVGRFLRV